MRILLFLALAGLLLGNSVAVSSQNLLDLNGYLYTYPKFYPDKTDRDAMGFKGNVKSVKTINLLWDTVTVVKEVLFRLDGNIERITYKGLEQRYSDELYYYNSNGKLDSTVELKTINNIGIVDYGLIKVQVFIRSNFSYSTDIRKQSQYTFVYTEGIDSADVDSSFMEEKWKNGRIMERTYYHYNNKGEKSPSTDTYTYLDKEHLITEGTGYYKSHFLFNNNNKSLAKYYTEGAKETPQSFEFNSFGHIVKVVSTPSRYLPSTIAEFSNTYDATGNIIKQQYFTYSSADPGKKGTMGKQKYIIEYY